MIIRQAKSLFLLMLCLLIFSSNTAHARSENEIKAVYLYNFIKFITWPQEPTTSDINICIYGDSPFGQQTEKLNTLKARNRPLHTIYPDNNDAHDCSVIVIGPTEQKNITDLLLLSLIHI